MDTTPARTADSIQQRLTDYACSLSYEGLTAEAVHAAKVRVIDTLAALIGGFDDAHLRSPELRALLAKIEVVANDAFTRAYEKWPVEHRTRVTVVMRGGERLTGEAGGEQGDLSEPKSDDQIAKKFVDLAADFLGTQRAERILARLWELDGLEDVARIPKGLIGKR